MPRIYRSDNIPMDFCMDCFPDFQRANFDYGDEDDWGFGPDERGNCFAYDTEHPDYDSESYLCWVCKKSLDWLEDI